MSFVPTHTAALERLQTFLPKAGRDYAARRNYDLPGHPHVSGLSPYLRHRILTEEEVLQAVLGRHAPSSAEKFVQEVFWRTYWKGWLEMRPTVWTGYRAGLTRALDRVQTEAGLRAEWEAACSGTTGIAGFDHWARELVETGYLHNHARMWFASIWIFTLRLPWELGADFFLRHLLDGDAASNTLSWRWVAGLQTQGKNYVARVSNISKYTEGRHRPLHQLATDPAPLDGPRAPAPAPLPPADFVLGDEPTGVLLTEEDLSPGWMLRMLGGRPPAATLLSVSGRSPLAIAPAVAEFTAQAMADCVTRHAGMLGRVTPGLADAEAVLGWARASGLRRIVTPYAPVGPAASQIAQVRRLAADQGIALSTPRRAFDEMCWPHATKGFFKFKEKIPRFLAGIRGLRAAEELAARVRLSLDLPRAIGHM